MLDYEGLHALQAVCEVGNFSKAAIQIGRTQSAISQRIANLERLYGQPLLIRGKPILPTEAARRLIDHYNRVKALERMLDGNSTSHDLEIAINRDSLETWLKPVLAKASADLLLHIRAADQDDTLELLKKGSVQACVTTEPTALPGCVSHFIGTMRYVPVCTPRFQERIKKKKLNREIISTLPSIVFDKDDRVLAEWLMHYFDVPLTKARYFSIPSCSGFVTLANSSQAYGLIPRVQINQELASKQLTELAPGLYWDIPLYWQSFDCNVPGLINLTQDILEAGEKHLTL